MSFWDYFFDPVKRLEKENRILRIKIENAELRAKLKKTEEETSRNAQGGVE